MSHFPGWYLWLLLPLSVLGVVALVGFVVTLFLALGRRPKRVWSSSIPSLTEPDEFLLALSGLVNAPTRAGGTVEILRNGTEIFPAIIGEIERAHRSVNFMAYICERGEASDRVLGALTEAARRGVQVRMMVDAVGGIKADEEKLGRLEEAGGSVVRFRPLRLGMLSRFHRRNHRRAIIVDGEVAFTGGAAIADLWLDEPRGGERWRDNMYRLTGPLAHSVQAAFTQLWSNVYGEILTGPDFYPFRDDRVPLTGEPVSRHMNVLSSPSDEAHPLRKFFWLSFAAARERIYVTTPYFVPDRHLRRVLKERAKAGVDVRLLLPNRFIDVPLVRWASQSYYEDMLKSGVRIYEYQPAMIHAKTLVVDGRWTVIGSANLDIRSKELNEENVLGILDDAFAGRVEAMIEEDLRSAEEIQPDRWKGRGVLQRTLGKLAVLFEEQY